MRSTRIAVLADIHGNDVALEAVLSDAAASNVDAYWVIGDHVAIGPEPGAVLERLSQLPDASFTRGNTDRYVVTGETPSPTASDAQADARLAPLHASIASSFSWTRGYVTAAGGYDWLAQLPLDIRFMCADGIRVLAVHASPGTDDGPGIHPGSSNHEIEQLIGDAAADLILVGHTHEPMVRRVGSRIVINTGSVGNPHGHDLRASYVILDSSSAGTSFSHRRVEYDHMRFAESVRRSHHPSTEYIMNFQRGAQAGRPPHADHTPLEEGRVIHVALDAC